MSFSVELHKGFSEFRRILQEDHTTDVLLMSYAEYSLQLYILYHESFYNGLLRKNSPLSKAFCAIGVNQPLDQFTLFMDSFYLYWHTQETSFQ